MLDSDIASAAGARRGARLLAGAALCFSLAAAATWLGAPLGVPVMLAVLVLGMGMRAVFPALAAFAEPGVQWCARDVLRIGVALLGFNVVLGDIAALGAEAISIVAVSLVITVAGGFFIARMLGEPRDVSATAATSVAVCGASAALAASAAAPQREGLAHETAIIIVVVSLLSTLVMVLYPPLALALGFDAQATALLLGAAIHDVAQVAGAGFMVSEAVGVEAVTVKMIRVACLLPVVLAISYLLNKTPKGGKRPAPAPPAFLIAFFVFAAVASAGFAPQPLVSAGAQIAPWALATAVAALGVKTSFADLRAARPALLLALTAQTLLQLALVAGLIWVVLGAR